MENQDEIMMRKLEEMERNSPLQYDPIEIPQEAKPQESPLGKASFAKEAETLGMEAPWKILPLVNLPSEGFGYPNGLEMAISSVKVNDIRHYSTIDEHDPIDIDDKINHILNKNTTIRYSGGILSYKDLYQEDRFYIFMAIRDFTFIKGENKLMIPLEKKCTKTDCNMPTEIELKSHLLTNFKLPEKLLEYYNPDYGCYILKPKNGEKQIELFIPTIGVVTGVRKILRAKKKAGKKFDEAFANYSTFLIPNWRDLDEASYDHYERESRNWTYLQFNIVDQITKEITFATKNQISLVCQNCGAEVTAPLRFLGGLRSLYIIPDIFGELQ